MAFNQETILRYLVALHFIYTSFVLLASWLPMSYTLNQICIIVLGLWAIVQREGVIQVELLMVIKCFSIVLDTVAISMYFRLGKLQYEGKYSSYFALSAFFALFLLILKPLMLLLLNKVRKDRAGDTSASDFSGWGFEGVHVPGYQPVGAQTAPSSSGNNA